MRACISCVKTPARQKPSTEVEREVGTKIPLPPEKPLMFDSFWEKENQFVLMMWPSLS